MNGQLDQKSCPSLGESQGRRWCSGSQQGQVGVLVVCRSFARKQGSKYLKIRLVPVSLGKGVGQD